LTFHIILQLKHSPVCVLTQNDKPAFNVTRTNYYVLHTVVLLLRLHHRSSDECVCLPVILCVSVRHISRQSHVQKSPNFQGMLLPLIAVAQSSGGTAIMYASKCSQGLHPVLWMKSCLCMARK